MAPVPKQPPQSKPQSSLSGVVPAREKDVVQKLVDTIDAFARTGRVDPHYGSLALLEALENCNQFHWAAYAKMAKVLPPSYSVIDAVKEVYRERIEQLHRR